MRGLCGWFGGAAAPHEALAGMLAGVGAGDGADRALPHGAALAAYGGNARPRLSQHEGMTLILAGHPRLRAGAQRLAAAEQIADALRARGREALADLGGDFALAAWDSTRQRGWLAIDRIGIHPLVYTRLGDTLLFASSLDALCGHPDVHPALSSQAIYDYLYYHVCPGPDTIYQGMQRLGAGQYIEFGDGAAREPQQFWQIRFAEDDAADFGKLKAQFVSLLEAAVGESTEGAAVGAFLSGGTDSSTVNGMLCRVSGRPAPAYSIGFDVPGFDETEYARIAARHFGCAHVEYYVTPADVVEALPRLATAYDQPFGNASAVPAYLCARHARSQGIERLLAGDGGDELFGGNERYAKQLLLGHYQRLPAALRTALVEPLLLGTPLGSPPGLRKLRSYVEQARPPMPQRYESYNLLQHLGAENVLAPDFLASVDKSHPTRLLVAAHAPHADVSLINQMLAIDLRFVLADTDLPKVLHTCALADMDVAFPLLDDRLVEFSQGLPSEFKLRGTKLRWFFKQALADFLPPEILTKKKHGFGLPVGQWLIGHRPLYDLAVDSIRVVESRGLVQRAFVDELLERRLHEHPGYYGTMVWLLMVLGQWLDSRRL